MEKISIFNYEVFYLDFLEGNLNEEDSLLLLKFLEQHPELKVEDDMLVTMEDEALHLDAQFKADLKQISFDESGITSQNVEKFLIAETENLLSSQKQNELDQFVKKDASLIKLRKMYASTHLVADRSIVFENKNSLKQNKRIVLWPYLMLAAASIAVLLFFWNSTTNVVDSITAPITSNSKTPVKKDHQKKLQGVPAENSSQSNEKENNLAPINEIVDQNPIVIAKVDPASNKRNVNPVVEGIKHKQVKTLNPSRRELEIIENNTVAKSTPPAFEKEGEYTMLGFNEMNNPIKPITSRLGDAVKQEVDFRTAKATEHQSGGFYLKIGKLEISRRKF